MVQDDENGVRPLYRPKDWNMVARAKEKEGKKHNWSRRGGHIAPIFIPPTPNSELANSLREIANREAEAGVHLNIIETGGFSMRRLLQKSNPLQTPGCDDRECVPCHNGRGVGGNCRSGGVNYELECQLCPAGENSVYIGESSRNSYTRCKEHLARYRSRTGTSFILKHQAIAHQDDEPVYKANVTASTREGDSGRIGTGHIFIPKISKSRIPLKKAYFIKCFIH